VLEQPLPDDPTQRLLPVDPGPTSRLANWFKRPGTTDFLKSGNEVVYMPLIPAGGEVARYELRDLLFELGDVVDVEPVKVTLHPEIAMRRWVRGGGTRQRGKGNAAAPFRATERDMKRALQERGGRIYEGNRHKWVWSFAYNRYLLSLRTSLDDPEAFKAARSAAEWMDAHCVPPLSSERGAFEKTLSFPRLGRDSNGRLMHLESHRDANGTVRLGWTDQEMSARFIPNGMTLATRLGITEEEAIRAGYTVILPPRLYALKQERKLAQKQQTFANRLRREETDRLLREGFHNAEVVAELVRLGLDEGGHKAAAYVSKRRGDLGLPRSRAPRKRAPIAA
jgi:hypothetical protein